MPMIDAHRGAKREFSSSATLMSGFARESARKKRKSAAKFTFVPDVAIKIQLSDSDGARAVWVHRSRLGNVSTWFDRMATHSNVIELDHVRVGTLQAFFTWVYEDRVLVDGMEEEMAKGEPRVKVHTDRKAYTDAIRGADATGITESEVVDLTIDIDDSEVSEAEEEDEMTDEEEANNDHASSTTSADNNGEDLPWYMISSLKAHGQVFGRLLDLYTFSVMYEVPGFKSAVMLAWQRFSYVTSTYPCATVIGNVCQRVPVTSELVRYLVGCYAYYVGAKEIKQNRHQWKDMPSDFITEAFVLTLEERVGVTRSEHEPNNHWCKYHDHQSEEAAKACQAIKGRDEDPDMVYNCRNRQNYRVFRGCCQGQLVEAMNGQ